MDTNAKRKRKGFYRRCAAGERRAKERLLEAASSGDAAEPSNRPRPTKHLEPGMTGILISVNNKEERQALVEAYRLLNEAHERLHGKVHEEEETKKPEDADEEEEDIEAALRAEAKDDAVGGGLKFIFNGIKTGVANCAFVLNQSEKSSSAALVHEVFRHILETSGASCRRILRFQPVMATGRPDKADLRALVKRAWPIFWCNEDAAEKPLCLLCRQVPLQRASLIDKQLTSPEGRKLSYMVAFRARNYDNLSKQDAVMAVMVAMQEVARDWSPVCVGADLVISVDVLRNVLCLSFLESFSDFAKYNIRELAAPKS